MNISTILDTVKTTDDVKIQVNLLTGLTTLCRTKATRDVVVTSSVIYETAHNILSRGMGEDTARVLSFLAAVLRATHSEASGAAASRARLLIRSSGCLRDMTGMFLSTIMMYEETWKTLCECLAESCKQCMDNQNYCAGLIPTCIQRCNARNNEIIKILHSLLLHNARNIHIFVYSSGLSIFTRETLQDRPTMELLATVVQNSAAANLLQHNTELMKFLFTFEESCQGPMMVEWASIILLKISTAIEGVEVMGESTERDVKMMDTVAADDTGTSCSDDLAVSFLLRENWDQVKNNPNVKDLRINDYIASGAEQIGVDLSSIDLLAENVFTPNCTSTPKIKHTKRTSHNIELYKSNNAHKRANNSEPVIKQTLSTSARLFNIVNNSFVKFYKAAGNIFSNNPVRASPQKDIMKRNLEIDKSVSSQKFRRIEDTNKQQLRDVVRKLKTGIHIYGCNFKKISRAMWSHEKKITPQVLYCIYRKYIMKRSDERISAGHLLNKKLDKLTSKQKLDN